MSLFGATPKEEKLVPAPPGEGREVPLDREELVVVHRPYSQAAEQFRRMRNSLQALNADGASRSILMTSAMGGEGKTVATVNLALSLAELPQQRVLVVDADRLHPGVESLLGLPRRQGVTELLEGEISLEEALRPTQVERLDIVGAGAPPISPVLHLERVQAILHAFKRRYDYVLIDGPAVFEANHPSLLGSIVDGILLVVRMGGSPKQVIEEAFTMLESLGGNVLGTVATAVEGPMR